MTWTVLVMETVCGRCLQPVPAGAPVALMTTHQLQRCASCAELAGFPLNAAEIDLEQFRLEQERLRRETPAPPPVASKRVYVTPPRPVVAFSKLGDVATRFDPRAAAAGDRGDR